jgi:hypothetical protein
MIVMVQRVRHWLAAAGAAAGAAQAAWAGEGFDPPKIEKNIDWIAYLIAAVAVVGILVVGFKNAKRTHLD